MSETSARSSSHRLPVLPITAIAHAVVLMLFACGTIDPLISRADASPITVSNAFLTVQAVSANSLAASFGTRIVFGADVTPNGTGGTTGTASTTRLDTGATVTTTLPFAGVLLAPNRFSRSIAYDPNLTGAETLTFTNGTDTTTVIVPGITGVVPPPFASSVTISGASLNPTFSWSYPSGAVDAVTFQVIDASLPDGPSPFSTVFAKTLPGTTQSFTIPTALAGGLSLVPGHHYVISLVGTSGGAITNALSRSFFDFVPLPAGSPAVSLPTFDGSAYNFNLMQSGGETVFIDPLVTTGYDYSIGLGDPNFASVLLPNIGDGLYDLLKCDGTSLGTASAGVAFSFASGGLDCFGVRGIEVSAGLDPTDTTAFITGLTFTSDGAFTGKMTPITADVPATVPEPASFLLVANGLAVYLVRRKRKSIAHTKSDGHVDG